MIENSNFIMPRYKVTSSYFFRGKENIQTGIFDIDADGNVSGFVYDPNSSHPYRSIEGRLSMDGSKPTIDFIKRVEETPYANIGYRLEKSDGTWGVAGPYEGIWVASVRVPGELSIVQRGNDIGLTEESEIENKATAFLEQQRPKCRKFNLP